MAAPARTRARTRARGPVAVEAPQASAQDLALIFAALELRLSGLAQQALTSGQVETLAQRRAYQRQAASLIAALRADARPLVRRMVETAYGRGARLAGARPPGAIQRATLDQLAQSVMARLDGSLDTVGRQFDDVFRQVGLKQAARQLARELPKEAAADLMRRELMARGLTGFIDRKERHWRLSTYSRMALVTTASEAANRGVAEALTAAGRDLVVVTRPEGAAGCKHHPDDPANPCRALEGKVVSLNGKTPGYPVLKKLAPFHPYCTHLVQPARVAAL